MSNSSVISGSIDSIDTVPESDDGPEFGKLLAGGSFGPSRNVMLIIAQQKTSKVRSVTTELVWKGNDPSRRSKRCTIGTLDIRKVLNSVVSSGKIISRYWERLSVDQSTANN